MAPSDIFASDGAFPPTSRESDLTAGAGWLARRERTLWALALVALVADVVTTVVGLQFGLAEGNPVIAATLAEAGVVGFCTIKAAVLLGAYCCRLAVPRFRVAIPLGVALPWFVAAGANGLLLVAAT